MTTIIIRKDHEGIYRGFYCMGHAGYAKKRLFGTEPDILCAAISVLVQSTIGSLSQLAGEELKLTLNEETGFIKCDFQDVLQDKSVFLMADLFRISSTLNMFPLKNSGYIFL